MAAAIARYVIALDVGGTSVKSAVLDGPGRVRGQPPQTPIDSRAKAETIWNTMAGIIRQQADTLEPAALAGVGIGFPGPFDYEAGISRIRGVEKYEAIYGLDVGAALRARLGARDLPIRFRNDAEAAIVAEARYGAGRPYRRLIGVTLGTGMGSAFLTDGERVTQGPGVPENQGWLFSELFGGERADDLFSARGLRARLSTGGLVAGSPRQAAEEARQGNAAARRAFEQFGADLGAFLSPFARAFGAQAVLALGGIANAFDLFGPAMQALMSIEVRPGALGAQAGLIGAADLFYRPLDRPSSRPSDASRIAI